MSSTYKFKVGDIVEHIRGSTGKVTRVTADTITVVFEDSAKNYNYNSNTKSLRLVKGKTVETEYNYPIYKQYKKIPHPYWYGAGFISITDFFL